MRFRLDTCRDRVAQVVHQSGRGILPGFERAGFSVLPAPTRFSADASALTFIERWTPQHDSLGMSRRALHEWLGMARDAVF